MNVLAPDLSAARHAQSLSLRASSATAVVPTALAAQGMVMVGHDALGLSLAFAVALAAFLELALISSALLARASAVAGRPAGADTVAVWVFSTASGIFSASHELIGPLDPATGQRGWQHDSVSLLAAGVRIAAPLVAAWLWERVLVSARREAAARSAAQTRVDRRLLAFARAAQTLRRLLKSQSASQRQIRRARRGFDRRHVALLRRVPATDPKLRAAIHEWLTEFCCADTLYLDWTPQSVQDLPDTLAGVADSPERRTHRPDTSTRPAGAQSDIPAGEPDSPTTVPPRAVDVPVSRKDTNRDVGQMAAAVQTSVTSTRQVSAARPGEESDTLSHPLNVSATTNALTEQGRQTADIAATCGGPQDCVADTPDECPPAFADMSTSFASDRKRLSAAVDIVGTHGHLSGSDMAKQMGNRGHSMSERTGLRWRDRAEEYQQQHQTLTPAC